MDKVNLFIYCLMFILALSSYNAPGEIYKWVDDHGNTHFTDRPPENTQTEEVKLKINTYSSVEVTPLQERLGRKDKVVMYSASWCGICKKAKQYFRQNNIPHITYDVEKSRVGKMDFKQLKGKSVPIILLGDKRMNGFTESRFVPLYKAYVQANLEQSPPTDNSNL